jgi:DNA-directed RNA polymerase specialized sigma24 family protein
MLLKAQGYPDDEAALLLGTTLGGTKSLVHRAREKLCRA